MKLQTIKKNKNISQMYEHMVINCSYDPSLSRLLNEKYMHHHTFSS